VRHLGRWQNPAAHVRPSPQWPSLWKEPDEEIGSRAIQPHLATNGIFFVVAPNAALTAVVGIGATLAARQTVRVRLRVFVANFGRWYCVFLRDTFADGVDIVAPVVPRRRGPGRLRRALRPRLGPPYSDDRADSRGRYRIRRWASSKRRWKGPARALKVNEKPRHITDDLLRSLPCSSSAV